jgi:hypothetical protein
LDFWGRNGRFCVVHMRILPEIRLGANQMMVKGRAGV